MGPGERLLTGEDPGDASEPVGGGLVSLRAGSRGGQRLVYPLDDHLQLAEVELDEDLGLRAPVPSHLDLPGGRDPESDSLGL